MDVPKVVPMINEDAEISLNRQCRICMEGENSTSPLLSPCKCAGSIKYIHEECLKTWLVSHNEDIAESCCELCKTPLLVEFKMRHKCQPRQSCGNGLNSCMFVPILVAIVVILFIIVYLLSDRFLTSASSSEEKGYTIALIITCSLSGIILSILIVNSVKDACLIPQLDEWKIFSQNFEESEESIEVSREEWSLFHVLIVPESTKIHGVRIKTPVLRPVLQLLKKRGNITAYTPQCLTPAMSSFKPTPEPNGQCKPRSRSPRPFSSLGYKSIPEDSLNFI